MNNDLITSHKLIFHPTRVSNWLSTGNEYPINAEIAISGACNHRCVFCCVDYMKHTPSFLAKELLEMRIKEMQLLGLKSVLLAGNGEPLLHKNAVEIINNIHSMNVDVALSTNGVLFTKDKIEQCMRSLTWIRYSVSAATEDNYKRVQKGKDGDFNLLMENIADAVRIKREQRLDTTLNVQIVMTPDNVEDVVPLAKIVRDIGVDRFIVKSVGWLPYSESDLRKKIDREQFYTESQEIINELGSLVNDHFECVCRTDRINNIVSNRTYSECLASAFHVCIDSYGNVIPCCSFLGVPEMAYGNITTQSFAEIWSGDKRKDVLERLKQSKLSECPFDCKLANMNSYLQELKHPSAHVNFI